jgi:hypothetical protein
LPRTGLSGRLWENGEFSIGVVPPDRLREADREYELDYKNQFDVAMVPVRDYRGFRVEEHSYLREERSVNIGLSRLINSHKPSTEDRPDSRKPRGSKGLSSYGGKMIRNACYRLEAKYGPRRLGFATFTLPSLRADLLIILAMEWSELVRQLLQEIGREVARAVDGWTGDFIGATEIQPERLERTGLPCPHLHLVYVAHGGDFNWYVPASKLRAIWKRIIEARLRHYLPHEEIEVDTSAAIDCQQLKTRPSAEMSKYLSKGSCVEEMKKRGLEDCIPRSWWHCSRSLKRAVKVMVCETSSELKIAVKRGIDLVERGLAVYVFPVERDGKQYGWAGKLTPNGIRFFRDTS